MTYQETLEFLFTRRASRYKNLHRIFSILGRLGHPQNAFPAVLITGTNGKGSVAKILSHILTEAGFRVGCFTSPHLIDFRERITINRQQISEADVVQLTQHIVEHALEPFEREQKHLDIEGIVSFFEMTTTLAFLYFARQNVDLAVLEVGIGGRLDATNSSNPMVSVITNVGLDHQNFLGDSIEEITREKSAIIRDNGEVVVGCQDAESLSVIEGVCRQKVAHLHRTGVRQEQNNHIRQIVIPEICSATSTVFSYHGLHEHYEHLEMPLIGEHQLANAAVVLATLEILAAKDFVADELAIRRGLISTSHQGRLECISKAPRILVDIAHNPMGASATANALSTMFDYHHLVLIIGVLQEKDVFGILRPLLGIADVVIFTSPTNTDRAMKAAEIASAAVKIVQQNGRCTSDYQNWLVCESVAEAIERASVITDRNDLICVTGSNYTVSDAILYLTSYRRERREAQRCLL